MERSNQLKNQPIVLNKSSEQNKEKDIKIFHNNLNTNEDTKVFKAEITLKGYMIGNYKLTCTIERSNIVYSFLKKYIIFSRLRV